MVFLYHATNSNAAKKIKEDGSLRPGDGGYAGRAIYFSSKEEAAKKKMQRGSCDVVIRCSVDLGRWIQAKKHELNENCGFDSVIIRYHDVYAVYDPARIEILEFKIVCTGQVKQHRPRPPSTPILRPQPSPQLLTIIEKKSQVTASPQSWLLQLNDAENRNSIHTTESRSPFGCGRASEVLDPEDMEFFGFDSD
jgi:hypothetical protein